MAADPAPLMAAPAYEDERYFRSLPKEELAGSNMMFEYDQLGNPSSFRDRVI